MSEPARLPDAKFQCEECGNEIDADPDTMLVVNLGVVLMRDDEPDPPDSISLEELESMSEYALREIGLTPEQRTALLAGEEIAVGGTCICKECQDRLAS